MNEEQYFAERAEADARRLGAAEKHNLRKSRESGARSGTLYSGVQTRREGQVMADTQEGMRQAYLDREMERYNAYQRDLDRQHQIYVQNDQQEWQTGEREGTQAYTTGQNEQLYGYQQQLQAQAEQAKLDAQNALQTGQMTQLEYQQTMADIQAELDRELQLTMQGNEFGQEAGMANLEHTLTLEELAAQSGYSIEQMAAQYGFDMGLMNEEQRLLVSTMSHEQANLLETMALDQTQKLDFLKVTNEFENMMANQQRGWDEADQVWDEMMANLDAQVTLTINGFDWDNDGNPGGYPLSFFEGAGQQGYVDNDPRRRPGTPVDSQGNPVDPAMVVGEMPAAGAYGYWSQNYDGTVYWTNTSNPGGGVASDDPNQPQNPEGPDANGNPYVPYTAAWQAWNEEHFGGEL